MSERLERPVPSAPRGPAAPFFALATCIAVQLSLDWIQIALRGDPAPPGYFGLTVLLTGPPAIAVATLVALLRRPAAWALGGWASLELAGTLWGLGTSLAPDVSANLRIGAIVTSAAVLGTATAWLARRSNAGPAASGVLVGLALFAGIALGPPLGVRIAAPVWLPTGLVHIAALAALSATTRRGWIALRPAWALAALALVALATPIASTALRPGLEDTSPGEPGEAHARALPNLLVLILDTLRQDHLSVYGYERETTPELARHLAARPHVRFERAYAPSNWTIPSHLSFFTGRLPSEHQAHCANDFHRRAAHVDLPETLAERLSAAGYRTAGVIANPNVMGVRGMGRGFDVWELLPSPKPSVFLGERIRARWLPLSYRNQAGRTATARAVGARALTLLDDCKAGGCLVVANYIDVHAPFEPSAPFAGRFDARDPRTAPTELTTDDEPERVERAIAAYDEEILALDAQLGRLLDTLAERGLLDSTWVVVTSDHGEAFAEHGSVHHASSIYEEQIRIPLIVLPPTSDFLPNRDAEVDLLDLAATLAAIGSGETLGRGRDLRAPTLPAGAVRVEFYGCPHPTRTWGPYAETPARAAIRDGHKLIEQAGRRELYLLDEDPHERANRAALLGTIADDLTEDLPPLSRDADRIGARAEIDPATQEALRAMGYIE